MDGLKIEGLDKLQKSLKNAVTLDDVKKVVKHNGSQLQRIMQRNADFKRGYATGTTKRSIGLELVEDGFVVEVGPTTGYSPYLEYGTRYMEAQPFVGPAFKEQRVKFRKDMKRLVK